MNSIDNLKWDKKYPDKEVLKEEVNCMVATFVEVLLNKIPPDEIQLIYFKGSGQKDWDTPIDYVPEISDVDIHILLSEDSTIHKYLGRISDVLEINHMVEERYRKEKQSYLHFPRPQLVVLNDLLKQEDFIPTPGSAVSIVYGEEYPGYNYNDMEKIKNIDCKRLKEEEETLSKLPLRVIDKPGRYLWEAIRNLVWHVSPVGPRILDLLGVKPELAWEVNRTAIISMLKDLGEKELSKNYTEFYLHSWDYFLSGYRDREAVRTAIKKGYLVLERALEIATT